MNSEPRHSIVEPATPFTLVKVKPDVGRLNNKLGKALFPQRFSKPIAPHGIAQDKGKRKLFKEEPPNTFSKPPLTFGDMLGEYISLVDFVPLPISDYLSSTDLLALVDCGGINRNDPRSNAPILNGLEGAVNIATL